MLLPGICNLQLPRSTPCLLFVTIQGNSAEQLDLTGWAVKASVSNRGEPMECECSTLSSSGKTKIMIPRLCGDWEFYEAAIIAPDERIFRILKGEIGLQDSLISTGKHVITVTADLPPCCEGLVTVTVGYLLETESAAQRAESAAETVKKNAETVTTKTGEVAKDRISTERAREDATTQAENAEKSAQRSNAAAESVKKNAETVTTKAGEVNADRIATERAREDATTQAENAEKSSRSASDSAADAQGAATSAGQAADVALVKSGRVEELHRQVVTLEASAAASAANATASANSASATLKSAIKTGQLETATLGGGLTVAGEIIAQSPPKSMNAALRLDDTLAGLILPKKLDVQLDVSRLPMIGTGAKNHYFGIDFGPLSSAQVKGVKIPGLYFSQEWATSALVLEFWQWLGANIYICARRPALSDKATLNAMATEHDRLIDGCAQFAFIAHADAQKYDLECLGSDGTITKKLNLIDYPSHNGCLRVIIVGRAGSNMIDLYMSNNVYGNTSSELLKGVKKIGEATLGGGDWRVQALIGFLPGGVLGGAGHAYRYRTPYLSRVTWLFGNDITSKIQQLVL